MALINLKSDLSKFRMPEPQVQEKPNLAMPNKNFAAKSPIDEMIQSIPDVSRPSVVDKKTNQAVEIRQKPSQVVRQGGIIINKEQSKTPEKKGVTVKSRPRIINKKPIDINVIIKNINHESTAKSVNKTLARINHLAQAVDVTNLSNISGRYETISPTKTNKDRDGIPTPYVNTVSLLGNVVRNNSVFNIDGILNKYQNLVGLGIFNPNKPTNSILDFDSLKSKYIDTYGTGLFTPFNPNQSVLDVNSIPSKYLNTYGTGLFTPFNPNQSGLDNNSIPSKYINTYSPGKFTPFNPNQSGLDINSIPNKYVNIVGTGKFNPMGTSLSNLDNDAIPTKYSNIFGTGKFNPFNPNQSALDVNSIPVKYINIYQPGKFNPLPSDKSLYDIDSIPSKYSNTYGLGKFNPKKNTISQLDWDGINPPAFAYPHTYLGPREFKVNSLEYNSNLPGLKGDIFELPKGLRTDSWKGDGINTQLVASQGSSTYGTGKLSPGSPLFGNLGFNSTNKYEISSKLQVTGKSDDGPAMSGFIANRYRIKNSPTLLEQQYAKYNLREEAHNSFFIKEPYILRGIQREGQGRQKPQSWGIGGKAGITDGLIRGGFTVATERSLVDVARIGKFMASPKGLLFALKQVGLGLSNPKVETIDPAGILRPTRVHTGLPAIAQVGVNAFGQHLMKHGLVLESANGPFKYENVKSLQDTTYQSDIPLSARSFRPLENRLLRLKGEDAFKEVGILKINDTISNIVGKFSKFGMGPNTREKITKLAQDAVSKFYINNGNSLILSGLAGPNSVYGVGVTGIKLYSEKNRPTDISKYGYSRRYITNNELYYENESIENSVKNLVKISNIPIIGQYSPYPFKDNVVGHASSRGDNYVTLVYSDLKHKPGIANSVPGFKDFRTDLPQIDGVVVNKSDVSVPDIEDYYKTYNRESKFGFRKKNAKKASDDHDAIINTGLIIEGFANRLTKIDDLHSPDGQRDFIKFYFTGPNQINGNGKGEEALLFRATIKNIQDSISPQWQSHQMIGRADPVWTYQSWQRQVSFQFDVYANNPKELKKMWQKINYITSWTAPKYSGGYALKAPMIRITIGDMFQETPCFISTMSTQVPDQAPWEINLTGADELKQLPMVISINMTLQMIMDFRPQWNGRMYSLSDRGSEKEIYDLKQNWLQPGAEDQGPSTGQR